MKVLDHDTLAVWADAPGQSEDIKFTVANGARSTGHSIGLEARRFNVQQSAVLRS